MRGVHWLAVYNVHTGTDSHEAQKLTHAACTAAPTP